MLGATKAYEFTISFGTETDTLDAEGKVITTSDVRPSLEEIEVVLPRFTGEIEQVPPAYSALKIGGNDRYIALCRRHFFERLNESRARQLSLSLPRNP